MDVDVFVVADAKLKPNKRLWERLGHYLLPATL